MNTAIRERWLRDIRWRLICDARLDPDMRRAFDETVRLAKIGDELEARQGGVAPLLIEELQGK